MTIATRIFMGRDKKWRALDMPLFYSAPLPADVAVERARAGRTVFVRREDAGVVLEAVGE